MLWGDIELHHDENFCECTTMTRQGSSSHFRSFDPKIFPIANRERCPVEIYKLYCSYRPASMLTPDSPYYLAINHNGVDGSNKWYKCQPLGVNVLSKMFSSMAKESGLTGKITNHSLCKTMCTMLLHKGVAPTMIMQLSGHKNVTSVNNYAMVSHQQQKFMCGLLTGDSVQNCTANALECSSGGLVNNDTNFKAIEAISSTAIQNVDRRSMSSTVTSQSRDVISHSLFTNTNIYGGNFNIVLNSNSADIVAKDVCEMLPLTEESVESMFVHCFAVWY